MTPRCLTCRAPFVPGPRGFLRNRCAACLAEMGREAGRLRAGGRRDEQRHLSGVVRASWCQHVAPPRSESNPERRCHLPATVREGRARLCAFHATARKERAA